MKRHLLALGTLLILAGAPYAASANASAAGFATQSIFLSRSGATEGEDVLLYASVSNPSGSAFQGVVAFKDAAREIGSVSLSLSSGEARLVSISWQPGAGAHTITAALENAAGETLATETADFTISPKPAAQTAAVLNASLLVEPSTGLEESIASVSPQTGAVARPVLIALDNARSAAASFLDAQLAQAKPRLPGMVLGAETASTSTPASGGILGQATGWILAVFWTLYFYLLTVVRFAVGSVAFFYPIFVFVFFYVLFKLYRVMSAPRY